MERKYRSDILKPAGLVQGTITYYELPVSSLMRVPGARDALLRTFRSNRLDGFRLLQEAWSLAVLQPVEFLDLTGGMSVVYKAEYAEARLGNSRLEEVE